MCKKGESSVKSLDHAVVVYANIIQFDPSMSVNNIDVYSRMLLWCESGSGNITVNGNQFRFSKGSFLILPWRHSVSYKSDKLTPFGLGGVHIIPYYSPTAPFKTVVAHNKKQIWWENNWLRDVEIPYLEHIFAGHFNPMTEGLKRLAAHTVDMFHQKRIERSTAKALALLFLEEIRYVIEKFPGGFLGGLRNTESNRLEKIMDSIRDNLSDPNHITLQCLCDVGGVSLSTLRRLFLKSVGVSPYEWILQTRLEQARYYLRTTSDSVAQIGLKTGFEDSSYFVRFFHQREGRTPQQYRLDAYQI